MVLQLPERCYCADVVSKEPHFFPAAEQMRLHGLLWFVGDGKPSALADYSYRHLGLPLSYSAAFWMFSLGLDFRHMFERVPLVSSPPSWGDSMV